MAKKITDLAAASMPLAGTELVEIVQGGVSKQVAVTNIGGSSSGRTVLTADRTYYVRSDGSDSNDGLTNNSGGALLTIPKAVMIVCGTLDMADYQVTIQANDATRTEAVTLYSYIGNKEPILQGNTTTPANCILSTTSATCITNNSNKPWTVKGFKLQTTTSGNCLTLTYAGSVINGHNLDFGACAGSHMSIAYGAMVVMQTAYTISGGAAIHHALYENGGITVSSKTVTITGTPNFSNAYLFARNVSQAQLAGNTYSGSATGVRYSLSHNAVCNVNGAATTYLPGNSAGSTASGAQYA